MKKDRNQHTEVRLLYFMRPFLLGCCVLSDHVPTLLPGELVMPLHDAVRVHCERGVTTEIKA